MQNKKILVPPIKSQGIKTKLVPWITNVVDQLGLDKKKAFWIEPFFGTGVVGFNSGFKNAIVGDTNPHIINFYNQIKDNNISSQSVRDYLNSENELLKNADDEGYAHYRLVKDRFNKNYSSLDFLFLSRAGFNGMMRFNSKGKWNIPFCKKPDRFAQAYVTKICNQVNNVQKIISSGNWEFKIQPFYQTIELAKENDIIYCDPPYYGRYVDYYNGWTEKDEESLFDALYNTKAKFVLSTWHHNNYRENEMIEKFWSKFNIITKDHFYHSGGKIENRQSVVEALVFNFDIDVNFEQQNIERTLFDNL
ncbi:Dam family site-specific DNA-(adenine-N6)-methyltransferase [Macellibacteroides fermentans]